MSAGYASPLAIWLGGYGGHVVVPGTATRVLSATASTIPGGRTLVDVHWVIRDMIGGSIVKQFGGAPDVAASGSGLDGTNLEATVSNLPSTGYIELTITDSFGTTSSAGISY